MRTVKILLPHLSHSLWFDFACADVLFQYNLRSRCLQYNKTQECFYTHNYIHNFYAYTDKQHSNCLDMHFKPTAGDTDLKNAFVQSRKFELKFKLIVKFYSISTVEILKCVTFIYGKNDLKSLHICSLGMYTCIHTFYSVRTTCATKDSTLRFLFSKNSFGIFK